MNEFQHIEGAEYKASKQVCSRDFYPSIGVYSDAEKISKNLKIRKLQFKQKPASAKWPHKLELSKYVKCNKVK